MNSVLDQVRIILYRYHEKGLEVFLINPDLDKDPEAWKLPTASYRAQIKKQLKDIIQLDEVLDAKGEKVQTYAIEADWHEIPSVRGIIKHDIKRAKRKIKEMAPIVENGAYFGVKEAFKKVLPNEYQAVKELKDILFDRNTVTNL